MVVNARCDMIGRPMLVQWVRAYADESDIAGPRLTSAGADLDGLPELFVQYGELEVLRDQIVAFAERARAAGVVVTLDAVPDMFHDFQVTASMVPAGLAAVERIVAFLGRVLADRGAS
jgi:acetyl esterase/lipase